MPPSQYTEVICARDKFWGIALAISAVFLVLGIWIVSQSNHEIDLGGFTILIGSGTFTVMAWLNLPRGSFLGLNSDGLTVKFRWRTSFFAWTEIEQFGVTEFNVKKSGCGELKQAVGFKFTHSNSARSGYAVRRLNGLVTGFEAVLQDNYGQDCVKLAGQLEQARVRFVSASRVALEGQPYYVDSINHGRAGPI